MLEQMGKDASEKDIDPVKFEENYQSMLKRDTADKTRKFGPYPVRPDEGGAFHLRLDQQLQLGRWRNLGYNEFVIIRLFIYLFICLFIYLFVCLFIYYYQPF
jgi:hypothetical protein